MTRGSEWSRTPVRPPKPTEEEMRMRKPSTKENEKKGEEKERPGAPARTL
jgi:hypothetical protein